MINKIYIPYIVGLLTIVIFSSFMFFNMYNSDLYPLDKSRGHLEAIMSTSDPQIISAYLEAVKTNLPQNGNPVYIFSTMSSDFGQMHDTLDMMISDVESLSWTSQDSYTYQKNLADIRQDSKLLSFFITDAYTYTILSLSNIVFSIISVVAFLATFRAFKQKRNQINTFD